MVDVSGDVIRLIYQLLPGFLAAWIFYGLTAHLRMSPFERTVQALIFTAIVRACVLVIRGVFLGIGSLTGLTVGPWTENVDYLWSFIVGFILGHVLAYVANNNLYHAYLGNLGFTRRTSFPSEWFSTFARYKRYVTLHLEGGRRLFGWPF